MQNNYDPFADEESAPDFGSTEEVAAPAASNQPIMQWLHECGAWKFDAARPGGKGEKTFTRGWHAEAGKWASFDDDCGASGIPLVVVHHTTSGKTVVHWQFESALFFILARRLYSLDEMSADMAKRAGVAYFWPWGGAKQMSFQAVLGDLLPGYAALGRTPEPIRISVKGKVVNSLQSALAAQYRVIKVNNLWLESTHRKRIANKEIAADALCPKTPYSAFSVALAPGEEETATSRKTGQSFVLTTIAAQVPVLDPFADVAACKAYLREHEAPEEVLAVIRDCREEVIAWSASQSGQWAADAIQGSDDGEETTRSARGPLGDEPEDYGAVPVSTKPAQRATPSHPAQAPREEAPRAHHHAAPAQARNSARVDPVAEVPRPYERMEDVPGDATLAQRQALARFGLKDAAWRDGLSRQEAGKLIISAQKK